MPFCRLDFIKALFLPWMLVLSAQADEKVRFNRDVRPILSENCFACHGQDAEHRKAKLRLDEREEALAYREGIRAIVPTDLDQSEAWIRKRNNLIV